MPVHIPTTIRTLPAALPRLVLLPDIRDAGDGPRPALELGRDLLVFPDIAAALAALRTIEAG